MALRDSLRAILLKRETTYNTDPTPTGAADAILVRDLTIRPLVQETTERRLVRPYMGGLDQLPTRSTVIVEFELEAVGFGTAGPASPTAGYDAALRACALSRTISAGTKVDYAPVSTAHDSAAIYFYQDGTLHKVTGCRGTFTLSAVVNEIPFFKFTFTGQYAGVSDIALPSVTLGAYQQPQVVNSVNTPSFSIHGFSAARLRSFTFDRGNQVISRNLVGGSQEVLITGYNPTGKIQIEATTVAAMDWWTPLQSAASGSISLTHGSAGRRWTLSGAQTQIVNPDFPTEDGIVEFTLDVNYKPASGGDDFLLSIL